MNSSPIACGPCEAFDVACDLVARCLAGIGAEPTGAFEKAHAEQEIRLASTGGHRGHARDDGGKGGEIDMRGEVGFAGIGQPSS